MGSKKKRLNKFQDKAFTANYKKCTTVAVDSDGNPRRSERIKDKIYSGINTESDCN